MNLRPFHLALPVHDLEAARGFYGGVLGCSEGRTSDRWIDYDLFGHQFVAHLVEGYRGAPAGTNAVDKHQVPVPHFGIVFRLDEWQTLADRLAGEVDFIIEPHIRYEGQVGEQGTMFFLDPSGNALEFKGFRDPQKGMFAT